jgi:ketosteroid isomerase-like protein
MLQKLIGLTLVPASLMIAISAQADAVNDVRCAEIAFSQSVENMDQEAFAELVDPDARFVSGHSRVAAGKDAVVEAWSGFFEDDSQKIVWRPIVTEVVEAGDLGLSRGPYRLTGTGEDGTPWEVWGFFNSVWRLNDDGNWRVVFDAGNPSDRPVTDEMKAAIETPVEGCD